MNNPYYQHFVKNSLCKMKKLRGKVLSYLINSPRAAELVFAILKIMTAKKWFRFPYRRMEIPLGYKPRASKDTYEKLASIVKLKQYIEVDEFECEAGFAVNKEWFHALALHTQIIIKESELCYQHGRLLYTALRSYIKYHSPSYLNILETGTARGFSALCMAKALADADIEGKIITFDILPHNTRMYWNCIDDLEGPKCRGELLKDYINLINRYLVFHEGYISVELPKVTISRIHFAFFDCASTYRSVMNEFKSINDKQIKGDIVFYDDYTKNLYPEKIRAVDEICNIYKYSKRIISANSHRSYAILTKK